MFVNVTDFTREIPKNGLQRFLIYIESMWNDNLNEVYADVNLSQGEQNIAFRTPSVDLNAWEMKTLEGFVDSEEMDGVYDVKIILNYAGEQSFASGELIVKNEKQNA